MKIKKVTTCWGCPALSHDDKNENAKCNIGPWPPLKIPYFGIPNECPLKKEALYIEIQELTEDEKKQIVNNFAEKGMKFSDDGFYIS